jgi:perosamine synthetase
MRRRYYHDELGFNFRMTDIHAAIGLAQLMKLDGFNAKRRKNSDFLSKHLNGVITPSEPDGCEHVYHQYTIRIKEDHRDNLRKYLFENGIGAEIYYPVPIHKQVFYSQDLGFNLNLTQSEQAAQEVLSLPVHPGLEEGDLEQITKIVNEYIQGIQ